MAVKTAPSIPSLSLSLSLFKYAHVYTNTDTSYYTTLYDPELYERRGLAAVRKRVPFLSPPFSFLLALRFTILGGRPNIN